MEHPGTVYELVCLSKALSVASDGALRQFVLSITPDELRDLIFHYLKQFFPTKLSNTNSRQNSKQSKNNNSNITEQEHFNVQNLSNIDNNNTNQASILSCMKLCLTSDPNVVKLSSKSNNILSNKLNDPHLLSYVISYLDNYSRHQCCQVSYFLYQACNNPIAKEKLTITNYLIRKIQNKEMVWKQLFQYKNIIFDGYKVDKDIEEVCSPIIMDINNIPDATNGVNDANTCIGTNADENGDSYTYSYNYNYNYNYDYNYVMQGLFCKMEKVELGRCFGALDFILSNKKNSNSNYNQIRSISVDCDALKLESLKKILESFENLQQLTLTSFPLSIGVDENFVKQRLSKNECFVKLVANPCSLDIPNVGTKICQNLKYLDLQTLKYDNTWDKNNYYFLYFIQNLINLETLILHLTFPADATKYGVIFQQNSQNYNYYDNYHKNMELPHGTMVSIDSIVNDELFGASDIDDEQERYSDQESDSGTAGMNMDVFGLLKSQMNNNNNNINNINGTSSSKQLLKMKHLSLNWHYCKKIKQKEIRFGHFYSDNINDSVENATCTKINYLIRNKIYVNDLRSGIHTDISTKEHVLYMNNIIQQCMEYFLLIMPNLNKFNMICPQLNQISSRFKNKILFQNESCQCIDDIYVSLLGGQAQYIEKLEFNQMPQPFIYHFLKQIKESVINHEYLVFYPRLKEILFEFDIETSYTACFDTIFDNLINVTNIGNKIRKLGEYKRE